MISASLSPGSFTPPTGEWPEEGVLSNPPDVQLSGATGATGADPSGDMGSAGYWSMLASAAAAVASTVGQIWMGEISKDTEMERWATQEKIADIMQGTSMAILAIEDQKIAAVRTIASLRSKGSLERADAEAELKIVRRTRLEDRHTRDFTRRRDHFYGHPQI